MRHLKKGRKFGRERKLRRVLMKSLAFSLLTKGRIETTEAKAKELRPFVEKIITRAKSSGVSNKRLVAARVSPAVIEKLFGDVSSQFKGRSGGYTRIVRKGR